MDQTKLEIIESNYRKLEDINNSCESLMQKIGHLQVDLINNADRDLEKFLNNINPEFSNLHQQINEVTNNYEVNKVLPARGVETFNSAEDEAEETE